MSSSNHFLAILPLFAILSLSPVELQTRAVSRGIASEPRASKYEERALAIDRKKIVIEKDFDLSCYVDKENSVKEQLSKVEKAEKLDPKDVKAVAARKENIKSLVQEMVELEESMKFIKEKNRISKETEATFSVSQAALKGSLEAVLLKEDVKEPVAIVEKPKAEESKSVEVKKEEPKKEEVKIAAKEPDTKLHEVQICELEDKNKALSKQIEALIAQQKLITENYISMNTLLLQIKQQQAQIPAIYSTGPVFTPQQVYPSLQSQGPGTWIFYPQNSQIQYPVQQQQPQQLIYQSQLGQQTYQQSSQLAQPIIQENRPSWFDSRFSQPETLQQGSFGSSPFSYSFSTETSAFRS